MIAMDWGTHRTLTTELGLTPGQVRDWIRNYYQHMFERPDAESGQPR